MDRNNKLATKKVSKLLLELALPAVAAQIVTLLYNFVDRLFIGRMAEGTLAMAGIGICAPVIMVIDGFAGLVGYAGAPLAAISMGRKNNDEAEHFLGNSFGMLTVIGVVMIALLEIFCKPLLIFFGASENILPYAQNYMVIYSLGSLFVMLTLGLNSYISTQGFAGTSMITTMLGGILNIILDPIFIFGLNMGVSGAALATVISQGAAFVWIMIFFFGKKTKLKVRRKYLVPHWKILKQIMILGASPFFMSISEGFLEISFNNQVLKYGGDVAVSAMTILFSYFQFLLLPCDGISQGAQPIISFNYGAENYSRSRQAIKLALKINTVVTLVYTITILAFPAFFISVFNDNAELVEVGSKMMRVYLVLAFLHGPNSTFQNTYNALGVGTRSFFFAFLRKIILLIPLLYIMPSVLPWGLMAVMAAEPIADSITTVSNFFSFRSFIKKKLPADR